MIVLGIILVLIVLVILFTLQLISKHAAADKLLVFYKEKRTQAKLVSKSEDKIEFSVDVPYDNKAAMKGSSWMPLSVFICRTSSTTAR